jgi:MarR family transcriptional regulator for hemolysin
MANLDHTLMNLTTTLTHVARAYRAAVDKMVGNFHLSHATAWPIVMIGRLGDGVRPGAVADALGLEPPSLVRVIDQLVVAGLVGRQDDASDRRAKLLYLTDDGRRCANQLEAALVPFRRKLFAHMDRKDVEACLRVLSSLDLELADADPADGKQKPA